MKRISSYFAPLGDKRAKIDENQNETGAAPAENASDEAATEQSAKWIRNKHFWEQYIQFMQLLNCNPSCFDYKFQVMSLFCSVLQTETQAITFCLLSFHS